MEINKELLLGADGRPVTQSLFLELGYTDLAIYTLKEQDHIYNGKVYPSIKRLYLETEDPTEYEFATSYFLSWGHWLRICENKAVRKYIDEWREELEYKLRSQAVKQLMKSAAKGNSQSAKWFADRGWVNRAAGRPSKLEVEKEKKVQASLNGEYGADVLRMFKEQ